jgi:CBS domain-containing protein
MNPREMSAPIIQDAPTVRQDDTVEQATRTLLDSGLPALPVVEAEGLLVGLFGEREFMEALFPGYVGQLGYAGFVSASLDDALEKRAACRVEPVSQHMNTEHVSVDEEFSDVGVAEIFIHHRVLIVPVERKGRPIGVITRSAFFQRLAERFLERA